MPSIKNGSHCADEQSTNEEKQQPIHVVQHTAFVDIKESHGANAFGCKKLANTQRIVIVSLYEN